MQQVRVTQAKLALEKSLVRALEAALLNVRDVAVKQRLLVADGRWFLVASLQKSAEELSKPVFDHVCQKGRYPGRICLDTATK